MNTRCNGYAILTAVCAAVLRVFSGSLKQFHSSRCEADSIFASICLPFPMMHYRASATR